MLSVETPDLWAELEALHPLHEHLAQTLDPLRRVVRPSFEREVLPRLEGRVLVRYARRDAAVVQAEREALSATVAELRSDVRRVLVAAQRHALDDVVIGRQAWDPLHDAAAVRALHAGGLLQAMTDDALPYEGRYRLHPDLPAPPEVRYDFTDAVMDLTDDLSRPEVGPIQLLDDLASLAAGLEAGGVRVTHAGTVASTDAKLLGRRLAEASLVGSGKLEDHVRWGRALRALKALSAVSVDVQTRTLHLDLGLESTLQGATHEACNRLVHRLVDRDLHVVVPAVREALRQAGEGAVDELVFAETLREQHRDILFPRWDRDGDSVYPYVEGDRRRTWDDEAFDQVEARMVRAVLGRMEQFGLVRRAPGVFAATADGRAWAQATEGPHPPIWVSGDLELIVPPQALTPWERFQIERLGRCLQRDVVDRYRLEREGLATWLTTHELDEALALLRRRCPAVPDGVVATLASWAQAVSRVVLTRGVLLDP